MSVADWIARCEEHGLELVDRGRMGFVPTRLLLAFRDWPDAYVRPLFKGGEWLLDAAPSLDPLSDYKWLLFRRRGTAMASAAVSAQDGPIRFIPFRLESPGLTFVYWTAAALFSAALWVTPFPPFIDYPQHVAVGALLRRMVDPASPERALYETNLVTYNGGFPRRSRGPFLSDAPGDGGQSSGLALPPRLRVRRPLARSRRRQAALVRLLRTTHHVELCCRLGFATTS